MSDPLLLSSFQPWLAHHTSNSSDDLLAKLQTRQLPDLSLAFVRQLPVETRPASDRLLAAIATLQPHGIICCGMAETRGKLTVESNAWCGDRQLKTSVDLGQLVDGLSMTEISHDAGKFVCEGLYYEVLRYLGQTRSPSPCIFLHVPLLSPENEREIMADFLALLNKMRSQ